VYTILICDDDRDIVAALKIYLEAEGYATVAAYTGQEALAALQAQTIHLILMDIMMPQMDGLTATARLRQESNVPVIFLTAKSEDADLLLGLNIGGDDYITKPFKPVEVLARVRSHLRRYVDLGGLEKRESQITIGGVSLDDDSKTVTLDGEPVSLTPLEYNILKFLMENAGKVFKSEEIYRAVWNGPTYGAEGTVPVHIRHLREKLELDPGKPRYLKVVWGQGYKFEKGATV
jgi:DNA-binding response OmpR family regulator